MDQPRHLLKDGHANTLATSDSSSVPFLSNRPSSDIHSDYCRTGSRWSTPIRTLGLSKRSCWFRIFHFLVLELLFAALAAHCAFRPLVLPSIFTLNAQGEVKGGFTILFTVWQMLALFPVRDILSYVFSSEWFYQFSQTRYLVPGITDRVSTLTAGQWDRVRHCCDPKASRSFRTAFLTTFFFIVLSSLAPGTINVIVVPVPQPMKLDISNSTIPNWNMIEFHFDTWNPVERARMITRLEQLEGSQFGHQNQKNWIVAWPPLGLPANGTGTIEYPSDVVRFGFNCQWEVPTWGDGASSYTLRGANWSVWDYLCTGGIVPRPLATILPMIQNSQHPNNGLSAYLFLGSNASITNSTSTFSWVDLTGLPSAYNLTGGFPRPGVFPTTYAPPVTTVLICDPQPSVSGGKVKLYTNGSLSVTKHGLPSIGNIPLDKANTILSNSLLGATSVPEVHSTSTININYIAASLFLKDPTYNKTLYPNGVPVLDLDTINENLDHYVGSSSKAYMDSHIPRNELPTSTETSSTIPVDAEGQQPKLALVTSKVFWVIFMACTVVAVLLLGGGVVQDSEEREPFGLGSVMRVMLVGSA